MCLMQVLGSENFLSLISFSKAVRVPVRECRVGAVLDYIVWYAKDVERVKYRPMYETKADAVSAGYTRLELPDGTRRGMTPEERATGDVRQGARPYMTVLMTKPGPGSKFEVKYNGRTYEMPVTLPVGHDAGRHSGRHHRKPCRGDREQHPLCHLFHGFSLPRDDKSVEWFWRRRESSLRRANQRGDCKALPADDHRPRRPGV